MSVLQRYWRIALGIVVIAALIVAPSYLNRYGLFILSQWAVMTIAAMGLNLTLGYAGQVSLAQGPFVGIGAYAAAIMTSHGMPLIAGLAVAILLCFAIGWILGYPALRVQHHYLAFVTLAFSTLAFLVFRNESWLTNGIYGISNIPRPTILGYPTNRPLPFYYVCLGSLVPRFARDMVADPLALGTRLRGVARKSGAGALARHRYAALYADGVRDRFGARGRRRDALCPADAIYRSRALQPVALARSVDDGDRRRRRFLFRAVPRRNDCRAVAGVAAVTQGYYLMLYAVAVIVLLVYSPTGILGSSVAI
jgi:branched-chain amino acid transport system permease protein